MLLKHTQAEKSQLEIESLLNCTFNMPNTLLFSKVLKSRIYTAQLLNFFFQTFFNGLSALIANMEVAEGGEGTLLRGKPDTEVPFSHGEELCWWALWW